METVQLNSIELVELNDFELEETNGGFGWYPGYNQDAAAVGKALWGAVGTFCDHVKDAAQRAYNSCAC